jgi:hypothetical protein
MRNEVKRRELKIPFGKHRETGRLYDATSVRSGLKCNCICCDCEEALEAVHMKASSRQDYFRHSVHPDRDCQAGLESLFHSVAKQILKESPYVQLHNKNRFLYSRCDIEYELYGKRPDAYISNEQESLVVEIFFSHDTKEDTLKTYLQNGEKVLKIDISSERKNRFNYERLKELILDTAPRRLYQPRSQEVSAPSPDPWWKSWGPAIIGVIAAFILYHVGKYFFPRKKRRRRH